MGETELGGSVTATKPTAKAKVETKVTTDPSKVDALTTQLVEAGSDLGLTVTATVGSPSMLKASYSSDPETTSAPSREGGNNLQHRDGFTKSQTSNSNWSFLFAPLLILLINTIQ